MSKPPEAQADDDLDDGHHAVSYTSTWVSNADTKAGLLAAVLALVVASLSQQSEAIAATLPPVDGKDWVAAALFGAVVVSLAASIAHLAAVLVPRTPIPQRPTRFGFPTLADPSWTHKPATRQQAADEAWEQARVLATIVSRKYRVLQRATATVFVTLALSLAWVVATALAM